MSFHNENVIEEIKLKADIVNVIGEFLPLKKRGRNFITNCPFHNEKTASFTVSPEKQIYHCFGCNASGNVFTFLMEHEHLSFPEALKYLADKYSIELRDEYTYKGYQGNREIDDKKERLYNIHQFVARYFYKKIYDEYGKEALAYARNRGLSKDTLDKFKIGYAPYKSHELVQQLQKLGYMDEELIESGIFSKSMDGRIYSKFFNRLIFPIDNIKNKIIGFGGRILGEGEPKYLNSPETLIFKKKNNLYGLFNAKDEIRKTNQIILMEGYMDVISVWQKGVYNAIASLGTALTEEQCKLMLRYSNEIVLVYDNDNAGNKATIRAIEMFRPLKAEIRVAQLTGAKDPDEYIIKYGLNAFLERIRVSKSSFIYLLDLIKDKMDLTIPEEKIKAIRYLIPEIMSKEDELLKKEYLHIISQEFNVDKKDLENIIFHNNSVINNTVIKPSTISKLHNTADSVRKDKAEFEVVQHLVNHLTFLDNYSFNDKLKYFTNELVIKILKKIEELYKDGYMKIAEMLEQIGDDDIKEYLAGLSFKDEIKLTENDFHQYVNKVIEIDYENRIKKINEEINFEDKKGNIDKLNELQKKWEFYMEKKKEIQGGKYGENK